MRKTIRFKIIFRVLVVVVIGFITIALITGERVQGILEENILTSEELRLEQYMHHIEYMQESVEYFGKLIATDEELQQLYQSSSAGEITWEIQKDNRIFRMLRKYLLQRSDCYQIDVVCQDGSYYSSGSKTKRNYFENGYYKCFKEKNVNRGYIDIHDMTLYSTPLVKKTAITYVFGTRYIDEPDRREIDIVLEVNAEQFLGEFAIDNSAVQAFALYNSFGEHLADKGVFSDVSERLIDAGIDAKKTTCENGNILICKSDQTGNWTAVTEISRELLKKETKSTFLFIVGIMILICVLLVAVLLSVILHIVKPIEALKEASHAVGEGNLQTSLEIHTGDEFEELGTAFTQMEINLQNYMDRILEYEKVKKDMEVDKLVLQINPHFIYNTLNTISFMAEEANCPQIEQFTNAFIALLHDSVAVSKDTYFTTLGQELINLENYVLLQRMRYEDKFQLTILVPKELLNCRVPNILLQPIVENAIFHGILARDGKGHITVSAQQKGNNLRICIEDDGIGIKPEVAEEILREEKMLAGSMRRIGTGNVKKRIEYIYGESYGLEIHSEEKKGTQVILNLPYESGVS